jgi:cell filamentation protein
MDHPYCYPGTDVLRNKEDIRDKDALERLERILAATQLETLPHNLPITPEGYRAIHRYMLEELYDWAGEYRWVDTGRTGPFCLSQYIEPEMDKRFAAINAEDNLRGLMREQFAMRAAEHLNELNAIHPFLDGNGRAQRAFLQILGEQAGHEIDLARIEPHGWNEASKIGYYTQNNDPLRDVIAGAMKGREEECMALEKDMDRELGSPPISADYTPTAQIGGDVTAAASVVAEGVSSLAESTIIGIADSFESLLGGGPSAPAPRQEPARSESAREPTFEEYVAAERDAAHQRAAELQTLAKTHAGATEETSQEEETKAARERGGGQSR